MKIIIYVKVFTLAISILASVASIAEDNSGVISQADVTEINKMADTNAVSNASDNMDDWFDSVLENFGFDSFGENNGKFILSQSQSVSLKQTDPQYGDALVNAFDKAMLGLQEKYVMIRFGRIATNKVRSFYSDRSTRAKEIDLPAVTHKTYLSKVLLLLEKNLDVTALELDKQLLELGVDPNELTSLTPVQKKDVFRDKFIKNTMRQASGSVAGLFPIQTSVITDSKGRTVVGVVAVASAKTLQIAKDISLQRQSLMSGKGRDIKSLLPTSKEEFIGTLGVRLAFDLDGTPAIISYGIASFMPDTGDDYINDELKADAKSAAIANADAQIAEIINGRMNVKNERQTGEEIRKYVEREMKVDSDTIEKELKNIIKITNKNAKSSASARLQGISTVKSWRYTTEQGQKFVGTVRVWRYSTLAAVKSFNKPKARRSRHKGAFEESQTTSKPVNTSDDF
jgi:hypothetical protein